MILTTEPISSPLLGELTPALLLALEPRRLAVALAMIGARLHAPTPPGTGND